MSRLSARLAKAETIVQRLHGGFDIVVVGQHENEAQAIEREGSSDPRYRLIINTWPPPERGERRRMGYRLFSRQYPLSKRCSITTNGTGSAANRGHGCMRALGLWVSC